MTPGGLAALGLVVLFWIGGMNLVARRYAERRFGRLGSPRAVWGRRGFFFAPDWMSYGVMALGAVILVVAGVWAIV